MVKDNYSSWLIDADKFSDKWSPLEKLRFFCKYAVLAPSGHNTQPWQFSNNDQYLLLEINKNRYLPHSGTLAAEPHISLGACLETLVLAARGFGYGLLIEYELQGDLIATIKLADKIPAEPSLLDAILNRVSNRHFFNREKLPTKILDGLIQHDLSNISIKLVQNRDDIEFISDLTIKSTQTLMSHPEFRKELSKWVRNNLTKKYDGMPGFVQKIPTAPSMIAKYIISRVDISKTQAKKDSALVINSGAMIIISVAEPSEINFLKSGRLYSRICVRAQQYGIATSGVGAAVIDPVTKMQLAEHLGLNQQPTALIRLGKTTKAARHTPRLPLSMVTRQP